MQGSLCQVQVTVNDVPPKKMPAQSAPLSLGNESKLASGNPIRVCQTRSAVHPEVMLTSQHSNTLSSGNVSVPCFHNVSSFVHFCVIMYGEKAGGTCISVTDPDCLKVEGWLGWDGLYE